MNSDPAAPMFEEHISIGGIGEGSVYADNPEMFKALVEKLQGLENVEGVLAAHVGVVPQLLVGKLTYVHHFRTVDKAARERVLIAAHAANSEFLLEVCEKAREKHEEITNGLPQHADNHELRAHHKLSLHRLNTDFAGTGHADWATRPSGSSAAKLGAVRVGFRNGKEGSTPEVLNEYLEEMRSLPAKFPLLKQVSVGRNVADAQLYPETGDISWESGLFFGYESARDKDELDSLPEWVEMRDRWSPLLGDFQGWDLNVDRTSV